MKKRINFELNGQAVSVEAEANMMLLDLLREGLDITGPKRGCNQGECGACTVLVNGEAINSCLYPALKIEGSKVMTVEGLGDRENLHPLQQSFLEKGAVQCGFCTPGLLISAYALLNKVKSPDDDQIKEALAGNLCRCSGYQKIIEAVKDAAEKMIRFEGENKQKL